jgi:hypothetical protein
MRYAIFKVAHRVPVVCTKRVPSPFAAKWADRRFMAPDNSFHYEFEYSEVPESEDLDSRGRKVTTVKCHGNLVAETREQLEGMFKHTPFRGRIVFDLSDVNYVDSAGLGALELVINLG